MEAERQDGILFRYQGQAGKEYALGRQQVVLHDLGSEILGELRMTRIFTSIHGHRFSSEILLPKQGFASTCCCDGRCSMVPVISSD